MWIQPSPALLAGEGRVLVFYQNAHKRGAVQ
jgi:hypothetical protein